jgi:ATP-dependent exoDNAse (exonuclease V) beta subunit
MEFMPLRYSSGLKDTVFANQYYLEKAQSYVDNLNLLYVAFTRASDNLFVFAPLPEKEEKLSSTGELIYNWITSNETLQNTEFPVVNISKLWKDGELLFELGCIGHPGVTDTSITGEMALLTYPNNELKEKLRQRYSLPGFWDATENNRPPVRIYGNLMHRLFQEIYTISDIKAAVDKLIILGLIKESDRKKMIEEVQSILSEKPFSDWFSGSWTIMNEAGIFVPDEHLYRPDRVMTKEKETLVIDYKFGFVQNSKYAYQVKRYVEYLKAMGYSKVEGIIWYVNLNLVERI